MHFSNHTYISCKIEKILSEVTYNFKIYLLKAYFHILCSFLYFLFWKMKTICSFFWSDSVCVCIGCIYSMNLIFALERSSSPAFNAFENTMCIVVRQFVRFDFERTMTLNKRDEHKNGIFYVFSYLLVIAKNQ